MIIDAISDLHGHYPELEGGDLLIVAGDLTKTDKASQYLEFFLWLDKQNYLKKIVVAGNHDNVIQQIPLKSESLPENISYLCDSGTEYNYFNDRFPEEDEGFLPSGKRTLKIWGSPWTKSFPGMNPKCKAFTLDTEEQLAEKWKLIPNDVDILITHSPRLATFDQVKNYYTGKIEYVGSYTLAAKVGEIEPKVHVCGHIHEGYGVEIPSKEYRPNFVDALKTISVNASHVNEHYRPVNKPIRIIL